MRMHFLSGGRIRMRKNTYIPDTDPSEMIELPVVCVLLRHPQGNVLFDTGCHPSIADNPEPRWGQLTKFMTPIMTRDHNAISELKAIGLVSDDIDVVVCSHLHTDHCGCNAFFSNATVIVHSRELEAAKAPDAAKSGYVRADWDHPMPMTIISNETDVMGDGKIVLIPLPGHTPGTVGALIGLDRAGSFLLASDALSLRENLDREIIPRNTWNAELCALSFHEIRKLEASGVKVICSHDAAQWELLRKGGEAYD
jgi:glyoxylase-like metal-dependent hydrolase (beta-lactamase superfamily II)